jgi:biopolymer transport protein TolR
MGASVGGGGSWDEEDGFRPISDINVTPLVDVMLVLLIVFMVAAPLMTVGVPLQLPKSAAAKAQEPKEPIVVSIDKEGKVFLDKEELTDEAILARLTAMATQDAEQVVLVRGDKEIQYGRLMEIMGQISNSGFRKVSLITEKAPASPTPVTPASPTPVTPAPQNGAAAGAAPGATLPADSAPAAPAPATPMPDQHPPIPPSAVTPAEPATP